MGCLLYPDYSNKTINNFFSASLRNAAIPLLSLHSFMLGSRSIVQQLFSLPLSFENSLDFVFVFKL